MTRATQVKLGPTRLDLNAVHGSDASVQFVFATDVSASTFTASACERGGTAVAADIDQPDTTTVAVTWSAASIADLPYRSRWELTMDGRAILAGEFTIEPDVTP